MRLKSFTFLATVAIMLCSGSFAQVVEDFEINPPTGWNFYTSASDDPGFIQSSTAHTGSFSFYHNDDNINQISDSWMVSPAYTATTNDLLSFWYMQNFTPTYYEYSGVYISTASNDPISNPGDFIELQELGVNSPGGYSEDVWTEYSTYLNSYAGQTIYIAFKYSGDFSHEFFIDDFSLDLGPTCPEPTALIVDNLTQTTASFSWTSNGSESSWIAEYGPIGFTPGTGTQVTFSNNPDQITGLAPDTEYEIYLSAFCSLTDTSATTPATSFVTPCDVISGVGYCESFDSNSQNESCWRVLDENGDGDTWNLNSSLNPNSGDEVAVFNTDFNSGNNNDYLISPNINVSGNNVLKFSYRVNSVNEPNDFQVLVSTTGTNPADFTDTIMPLDSYNNVDYKDTILDLSNFNGNIYVAFNVPQGGLDGWILYIDDICFDVCVPNPSTDGVRDICITEDEVNLNSVVQSDYNDGYWILPNNQSDIYDDSLLNVAGIPFGTHQAFYIKEGGCATDTAIATLNISPLSSAGADGLIEICQNQPLNLFDGISGNVDLGGTWYDYLNTPLANSQPISESTPGTYNYRYIVENGICPEDTALLAVTVRTDCDYLSTEELDAPVFSIYPNPTSNTFTVEADIATNVNVELLNLSGKLITYRENAFAKSASTTFNISNLDNGVYFIRIYNSNIFRTFKIVKQ